MVKEGVKYEHYKQGMSVCHLPRIFLEWVLSYSGKNCPDLVIRMEPVTLIDLPTVISANYTIIFVQEIIPLTSTYRFYGQWIAMPLNYNYTHAPDLDLRYTTWSVFFWPLSGTHDYSGHLENYHMWLDTREGPFTRLIVLSALFASTIFLQNDIVENCILF